MKADETGKAGLIIAYEVVAELLEQKLGEELLARAESAARAVSITEDDLAAAIIKASNAIIEKAPSYARIAHQLAMRPHVASEDEDTLPEVLPNASEDPPGDPPGSAR